MVNINFVLSWGDYSIGEISHLKSGLTSFLRNVIPINMQHICKREEGTKLNYNDPRIFLIYHLIVQGEEH